MSSSFKQLLTDFFSNEFLLPRKPTTKEILKNRKNTFMREYILLNNLSISSTCSVKIENTYKTGHLTLKNSKLMIHQYESNKINPQNRQLNSIIETMDIFNPIFFIDFNMATCELIIHKKKQKFRLIILGKNLYKKDYNYDNSTNCIYKYRVVKFKMPNESSKIFNLICEKINQSIILSQGYNHNFFGINLRKNFCEEYFVNFKQLENLARTGDVLLFKGYDTEGKFQRFITGADYDHVALFIKNNDGLNVYEATGKEGVKLRPWQEFITYYWYLLYDIMAFRKLNADDSAMWEFISEHEKDINDGEINGNIDIKKKFYFYFNKIAEEFVEKTKDKKYYFSKIGFFCKSKMKKNSVLKKEYSCSELIAAFYYYAGIITDIYEARNYLPGNFAKKGSIPFKKGFYLGVEHIIDFSTSLNV